MKTLWSKLTKLSLKFKVGELFMESGDDENAYLALKRLHIQ